MLVPNIVVLLLSSAILTEVACLNYENTVFSCAIPSPQFPLNWTWVAGNGSVCNTLNGIRQHTTVNSPDGQVGYVVGGYLENSLGGGVVSSIYQYDFSQNNLTLIGGNQTANTVEIPGVAPSGRWGASAWLINDCIYVFCGSAISAAVN